MRTEREKKKRNVRACRYQTSDGVCFIARESLSLSLSNSISPLQFLSFFLSLPISFFRSAHSFQCLFVVIIFIDSFVCSLFLCLALLFFFSVFLFFLTFFQSCAPISSKTFALLNKRVQMQNKNRTTTSAQARSCQKIWVFIFLSPSLTPSPLRHADARAVASQPGAC